MEELSKCRKPTNVTPTGWSFLGRVRQWHFFLKKHSKAFDPNLRRTSFSVERSSTKCALTLRGLLWAGVEAKNVKTVLDRRQKKISQLNNDMMIFISTVHFSDFISETPDWNTMCGLVTNLHQLIRNSNTVTCFPLDHFFNVKCIGGLNKINATNPLSGQQKWPHGPDLAPGPWVWQIGCKVSKNSFDFFLLHLDSICSCLC